jgi:hypothetical protein
MKLFLFGQSWQLFDCLRDALISGSKLEEPTCISENIKLQHLQHHGV